MKNKTLIALVCVISLLLHIEYSFAQLKLEFSHDRGFYESSFQLVVTSSDPDALIKYTLDGSNPVNSSIAYTAGSPAEIIINPYINNGRAVTAGVVLRACAISKGDTSKTYTQSYIFLSEVKYQGDVSPKLLPYWPSKSFVPSSFSPNLVEWMQNMSQSQRINLKVDPAIVSKDEYFSTFEQDLLSVPTFSLVTDPSNLFDDSTGIYTHGTWSGKDWERPASLELITPSIDGFQVNTGIRIRGGWSSTGSDPKHAFRLYFREEYGDPKLEFSLFGIIGVDKFDKIDLRCEQNNSWNAGNQSADYIHDAFSREMQRDMNQPYTRSNYYHLYINGMYWGLYETQERAEASFAESYLGGKKEDYDVVKSSAGSIDYPPYTLEATAGNLISSKALWNIAVEGFSHDNYFKAMGLNPNGSVNPAFPKYLDVDNLISYMMVIYFSANRDGPASLDPTDIRINNFFGIFNRKDPDGFKFCIHDNETAYLTLTDNITNSPTNAGWTFESFNPMWLHQRLMENPDYKQRFADLAYKYLYHSGVLSPEKNISRFQERVNQIDEAIVGESARWGHLNGVPITKNNTWMPVVNYMLQTFFPQRTQIVINQFKSMGWLNQLVPPAFDESQFNTGLNGILIKEDHFKLINSNSSGQIYYTIDNSDPQASGGLISNKATQYSSEINASKIVFMKARVKDGNQWSPLTERIIMNNDGSKLKISEISYNPIKQIIGGDTLESKDLEFIEIKNFSDSNIELSGFEIGGGISYSFPLNSVLNANNLLVIASDTISFRKLYGFSPFGQFSGNLKNEGENINLKNPCGSILADIHYNSDGIWFGPTDGSGYTMVSSSYWIDQIRDMLPNWRVSTNWLGSPGVDDPTVSDTTIVISEILANSMRPFVDVIEFYNPNKFQVNIGNWFISEEKDNPCKWEIPSGTIIQPESYLSFNEGHYVMDSIQFSDAEFGSAFSLSKGGEKIFLYSANEDGTLKNFISEYEFEATEPNTSYGKFSIPSWKELDLQLKTPSFGVINSEAKLSPIIFRTIMYHPVNENFEFILLKNRTDSTVNLFCEEYPEITWKVEGVDFDFPKGISLAAGDSLFLVEKMMSSEIFRSTMNLPAGINVFNYEGKLKNSGESVSIKSPLPVETDTSIEFNYINLEKVEFYDNSPWPKNADGEGYALIRKNDNAFGNDPSNWTSIFKAVPFALAGNNLRVCLNSDVILDGSGSHDPSNHPLTYTWKLESKPVGSNSKLSNAQTVSPQITPDVEGNYLISLQVNNGSTKSASAFVSIFSYSNSPPVARFFENRNYKIKQNQSILLHAKDCFDPDYDKLTYTWNLIAKPEGSSIIIDNADLKSFNFTPDMLGNYQFNLVISDGQLSSGVFIFNVKVLPRDGVADLSAAGEFRVYPNPVKDEAFIEFYLSKSSDVNMMITDMKGRIIISRNYGWFESGNQIITTPFSSLSIPDGIYLINLRTKDNLMIKKVYYLSEN